MYSGGLRLGWSTLKRSVILWDWIWAEQKSLREEVCGRPEAGRSLLVTNCYYHCYILLAL